MPSSRAACFILRSKVRCPLDNGLNFMVCFFAILVGATIFVGFSMAVATLALITLTGFSILVAFSALGAALVFTTMDSLLMLVVFFTVAGISASAIVTGLAFLVL